jgi:hypothetical protein
MCYFHVLSASFMSNLIRPPNNCPPQSENVFCFLIIGFHAHFWVTFEELYERLIHVGVSKLLKAVHVKEACTYADTGQIFLATGNGTTDNGIDRSLPMISNVPQMEIALNML